ncbi:MAG: histidine kinase dimerization/phospho-acceptor domain-containing protein [bacterium]
MFKLRINVLSLVVALLFSVSAGKSESVYPVRTFEEGQFPKVGNVFGLLQDQQGILWIWGSRGITTYDGNRFTHFSTDQGLPSNYVYNIRQKDDGTLAICTYRGMVSYQPGSFHFTPVVDPVIGPIRDVVFHPLGLLLATDHGVILYRSGLFYLLPNLKQDNNLNHTLMVHRIDWDPVLNQVWAATDRWGLLRLNMDDLPPLLDLDPTYERPDSIIYDPLNYGSEVPSFSKPGHFRLADSTDRLERWHRVSTLLSRPESGTKSWFPSGWSTYGVLFDQRRARAIVWDNFNAYTVTHNTITRVVKFPSNVSLNSVVLLEDGRLSFARNDGLFFLEEDDSLHHLSAANGLPSNVVMTHLVDHEGHIWFVNNYGDLYRMTTTALDLYSAKNYPILQDMRQTLVTGDGEILAASAHGIVSVSNGMLKTVVTFDNLESDFINFAEDKKSNLLIGTTTRLYLFDRGTGRLRPLTEAGAPHVGRMDIARDGDGNLRFAYQELLRKWDGEKLSTEYFDTYTNSLFIDAGPGNRLHIGQWVRLITIDSWGMRMLMRGEIRQKTDLRPGVGPETRISLPDTLFMDNVAAMDGAVGPDGAYWVGTFNAGILRLEESPDVEGTFRSLKVFDTRSGLPTNQVSHLSRDSNGNLYFTLVPGAVMVTKDGLEMVDLPIPAEATIQDVLRIDPTYTVVASSHGLFLSDQKNCYGLDRNMGLPESAVTNLHLLPDNRFLAQQQNGFYIVDPKVLEKMEHQIHRPIVTEVIADGTQRDLNKSVQILDRRRSMRAHIALPDYFNESLHTFSWILEPFEESWRPWTQQSVIEYTNIPPGNYTLRVKARNGIDKRETFATPVSITVPPRFHETALFTLLMVLGTTMLLMLLVFWIVRRQQISQRKNFKMEMEQLRVANQLAATIAHEFNNPLQVMQGAYFMLKREDIDAATRQRYLDLLPKYIDRMRNLIQRLLRLKDVREMDYAAGLKILEVDSPDEPKEETTGSGKEP